MYVFVSALLEAGRARVSNQASHLQRMWPRHLLELPRSAPSAPQRGGHSACWAGCRGFEAYVHQLLLGVVLLAAVPPVAVGLVDDHFGLLLTVVPVQVFLEVSQLLLGEEQSSPRGPRSATWPQKVTAGPSSRC